MLSTKTISRLRRVQKALIAEAMSPEPKRAFVMDYFQLPLAGLVGSNKLVSNQPVCTTAACLGGTAVAIFQPATFAKAVNGESGTDLEQRAKTILGLRTDQSNRLFYLYGWNRESWSREFSDAYQAATTRMTRAAVAYDRIERFIQTNGEE